MKLKNTFTKTVRFLLGISFFLASFGFANMGNSGTTGTPPAGCVPLAMQGANKGVNPNPDNNNADNIFIPPAPEDMPPPIDVAMGGDDGMGDGDAGLNPDGTLGSQTAGGEVAIFIHKYNHLLLEGESQKYPVANEYELHVPYGKPAFTSAQLAVLLDKPDQNGNTYTTCPSCQTQNMKISVRAIECLRNGNGELLTDEGIKNALPPNMPNIALDVAYMMGLPDNSEKLCPGARYIDFKIESDGKIHLDKLTAPYYSIYTFYLMSLPTNPPNTPGYVTKFGEFSPIFKEFSSKEQLNANLKNPNRLRTIRILPFTVDPTTIYVK